MSAATLGDIAEWFNTAERNGDAFLIIACDTFDHEDYPVFCKDAAECWTEYRARSNGQNMQRVMEVYDMSKGWDEQSRGRAMNLPPEPSK